MTGSTPLQGAHTGGHTPGPWFRSGVRQKVGGSDTHSVVAMVDGKEIIVASVWYNPKTHEGFHDARLIAAAPELLERLQALIDWADFALSNPQEFDSHGVRNLDGPVFDEARAAISAATGQLEASPR